MRYCRRSETDCCNLIVPTLCVGMHLRTLRVLWDAERPLLHSHAERGNDQKQKGTPMASPFLCPSFAAVICG
ncbi:hypothetical protein C1893_05290 [Pseudomonas sp. MPR-ANC1]|nr:hypothetical protein C1893_05290 [Pseudomonas sp. MPR-ANC1]